MPPRVSLWPMGPGRFGRRRQRLHALQINGRIARAGPWPKALPGLDCVRVRSLTLVHLVALSDLLHRIRSTPHFSSLLLACRDRCRASIKTSPSSLLFALVSPRPRPCLRPCLPPLSGAFISLFLFLPPHLDFSSTPHRHTPFFRSELFCAAATRHGLHSQHQPQGCGERSRAMVPPRRLRPCKCPPCRCRVALSCLAF